MHPDLLEYNDYRMWNVLDENKILDAFQFDTPMGKQVIMTTQPRSMLELSTANTLMRLMVQEGSDEAPMNTYRRYKDNISLWYEEMKSFHLTDNDIKILEPHLKPLYGVADTQESIMELSMDPRISNFDVILANKLRKAVAKRKAKLVDEIKGKFYSSGNAQGTAKALLDYVWEVQIKRQLGYSFSKNHCMPYTCICIQCMNIVLKYGAIYWNTACLCVNSGSTDEIDINGKTTDYGKNATAIGKMLDNGIAVTSPEINQAKFGFKPDIINNQIIYGLKPLIGIGDDQAQAIIANQPYASLQDFIFKLNNYKKDRTLIFGDKAIIQLIKAGAFDTLENKPREQIMYDFISQTANTVKKLTLANLPELAELNILTPEQKKTELRYHNFRKYVYKAENITEKLGKSPATFFYKLERKFAEPYFVQNFIDELSEGKDYKYDLQGFLNVRRGALDKIIDKRLEHLQKAVLDDSEVLQRVNRARIEALYNEQASGTISKWEMDSMAFYRHEHELAHVNKKLYDISDFSTLPSDPIVVDSYYIKGKAKPRYELTNICGTVIDKDNNRSTITLLTPSGVATIKFYKGQYGFYSRELSQIEADGHKTKIEGSWFKRGTKLLVTGFKSEDNFIPKVYKDSVFKHSVQKIIEVKQNGELVLQTDRIGLTDETEGATRV